MAEKPLQLLIAGVAPAGHLSEQIIARVKPRRLSKGNAMAQEDAHGLDLSWPTVMLRRMLPGAEVANPALADYILTLEDDDQALTTDYRTGNFLMADHPAVEWLRDCINRAVAEYFRQLKMAYAIDWTVHGWANVNRLGDYHDPHNHPHCYLSGTYYVQVPTDRAPLRTRSDVRPGCITFYDPRGPAVNMGAIRGDPYIEPEHTVEPRPGQILLWPAFLTHFVHPNLSEPRISISFNVMLNWSDAYLPEQG